MPKKHDSKRADVYQAVTEAIIAGLDMDPAGVQCPWHRSTVASIPTNAVTGNPYRGVNVVALWAAEMLAGYDSPLWATYRQWQSVGVQVRRGERGSTIVFYKQVAHEKEDPDAGENEEQTRFVARASRVFNAQQVDGYIPPDTARIDLVERLEAAERLVGKSGADIRHGGGEAYYDRIRDHIAIPRPEDFLGTPTSTPTESYYGVLLHELVHWSGADHRLARDLSGRFGDQAYAMEELVAELGAAFLCAHVGVASEPRPDHAAYIGNWLRVLESDKRAVFTAASRASEAADYLMDRTASDAPSINAGVPAAQQ